MKTSIRLTTVVLAVAALLTACSKSEPPAPAAPETQKAAEKTATGVADATKSAAEAAKTAAQGAAAEMQKAADTAKTQASAQAQPLLDKAKALIAEKKYQDALASLQELSKLKLTPEQEKLLASLKEQVQKALTSQATTDPAKAAGNLLGK